MAVPPDTPESAKAGAPAPDPVAVLGGFMATVLDSITGGVSVWNAELRCVYANAAAACMLEQPREQLIGALAIDAIGEALYREHEWRLAPLRRGEVQNFEWQVQRRQGLMKRRLRLLPMLDSARRFEGFVVLSDDITEHTALRDTAAALAASETRFRALADALPVGVFHADADSRNTYTNARWREISGLGVEESLGDGWTRMLHPEDREAVLQRWAQTAAAGREFEIAARLVRPGGEVRHFVGRARPLVGPDGAITGYVGANEDVTDRLAAERARDEAERAAARSNEALRMLYEQTPAMLHSIDTEGRLLTVSDRWLAWLGHSRQEVVGRHAVDFLLPGSREAVLAEHLPRLWRDGRIDRLALQMMRSDGQVLDVLMSAVVERDAGGRPQRALAVIEDVTALLDRAAEARREHLARRQIERQARELARLASERREMLDLLAHEVRQPLNNASAALESAAALLVDQGEKGASSRLSRAQHVLADVLSHVDNTLAASTLLAGRPRPPEEEADIDTVLAVALAELPAAERARVTVRRHTAARTALMDSALVRLALRNLLGNAIRHTPPATPVTVQVSDDDVPLALYIDVTDEGGGLPPALLPHLFERGALVRHRDGRASHGLGLFIAYRALQVQGGELKLLHSGPGGTALRLVLPQGQAGEAAP